MTAATPKRGVKFVDTFRDLRMKKSIPEAAARVADYGAQFARLVKENACQQMFEGAQGQKLKAKLLLRGIPPDELREVATELTETTMKELKTDTSNLLKLIEENAIMFDEVRHYQKMVAAKEANRTRQSKKDEAVPPLKKESGSKRRLKKDASANPEGPEERADPKRQTLDNAERKPKCARSVCVPHCPTFASWGRHILPDLPGWHWRLSSDVSCFRSLS